MIKRLHTPNVPTTVPSSPFTKPLYAVYLCAHTQRQNHLLMSVRLWNWISAPQHIKSKGGHILKRHWAASFFRCDFWIKQKNTYDVILNSSNYKFNEWTRASSSNDRFIWCNFLSIVYCCVGIIVAYINLLFYSAYILTPIAHALELNGKSIQQQQHSCDIFNISEPNYLIWQFCKFTCICYFFE